MMKLNKDHCSVYCPCVEEPVKWSHCGGCSDYEYRKEECQYEKEKEHEKSPVPSC